MMASEQSSAQTNRQVLAVDLGGTNLRVAVVGMDGSLTHRKHAPTAAELGPASVLERMAELIQTVADDAGLAADASVGIASPGPINPRTGVVYFTPNLLGWLNVPLGPTIERLTGRVTVTGNDANCAGLGEVAFGAAKGATDVIYLGIGTGVGGAVISGGHLVDGVRGLGAELGHMCVAMDGPRCTCGGLGCLEAYVAGWAIARDGELAATTADGAAILRAAKGKRIDAGTIAAAAREGDEMARTLLARAGRALGVAIGTLTNIFNPQLVVVGGGVARVGEYLLQPAREIVSSHSFHAMRDDMRMVEAKLGDDGGLFGAGAMALRAPLRETVPART
jgi:glucokinase